MQVSPPWYWGNSVYSPEMPCRTPRYVDNRLLTIDPEVVLTKIAKFEVNAVPYQAGDILKVVGIVVMP